MSNASDILSEPVNIVSKVPSNWIKKNLVELCNPKQWKTISQYEMSKTGYPVFGANGFIGYYPEYNHDNETIAITCRGATCGTVNLVPKKTYITGNSMCLDNVSRDTDVKYLYYASSYRTLSDVISGSAQPQITGESLKFVILPIPPITEQKKIASILTSVDELIENTQKQIDKLQDLKKATMNDLLTKGIGHTEFKDSELGRIPKSWEVKRLDEVSLISRGKFSHRPRNDPDFYDGDHPFLQTGDIPTNDTDITSFTQTLNEKGLTVSKLFPKGTLVLTIAATIGEVGILTFNSCFPDSLVGISCKTNKTTSYFLLYSLRSNKQKLISETPESTQKNLNLDILNPFPITVPTLDEQKEIGTVLLSIDHTLKEKTQKLTQTQSLKKSLMQVLLTGKVRVKVN